MSKPKKDLPQQSVTFTVTVTSGYTSPNAATYILQRILEVGRAPIKLEFPLFTNVHMSKPEVRA